MLESLYQLALKVLKKINIPLVLLVHFFAFFAFDLIRPLNVAVLLIENGEEPLQSR